MHDPSKSAPRPVGQASQGYLHLMAPAAAALGSKYLVLTFAWFLLLLASSAVCATPLHAAAQRDAAAALKRLLVGSEDVDVLDARGLTPLHVAAVRGRAAAARLLLPFLVPGSSPGHGMFCTGDGEDYCTPDHYGVQHCEALAEWLYEEPPRRGDRKECCSFLTPKKAKGERRWTCEADHITSSKIIADKKARGTPAVMAVFGIATVMGVAAAAVGFLHKYLPGKETLVKSRSGEMLV